MLDKNHHSAEIFINFVEKDINNKKKNHENDQSRV